MKRKGIKWAAFAVVIIAVLLVVFRLKSNKEVLDNEVKMSQRKIEKIAVSVEKIKYGIIDQKIIATGMLEPSEALTVVSETQGKIIKVYKGKGDRVTVGDLLVKVDDEVIAANVLTAEANYAQYEKDKERLTRLSEENAVTKRDLEQTAIGLKKAEADLINARKALKNTSIKAPISGYVNNDYVTEGQLLGGGSAVCEIINNKVLKLNIYITENEVYKVKKGQEVFVNLTAFPGEQFKGKITAIAERANNAMKFNVEITLPNVDNNKLKSGLYAEAVIPVQNKKELLINRMAIVGSMEKPEVYLAKDGKAVKCDIILGESTDNYIEVKKGLAENDKLIVSGQLNLNDGDEVKVID